MLVDSYSPFVRWVFPTTFLHLTIRYFRLQNYLVWVERRKIY